MQKFDCNKFSIIRIIKKTESKVVRSGKKQIQVDANGKICPSISETFPLISHQDATVEREGHFFSTNHEESRTTIVWKTFGRNQIYRCAVIFLQNRSGCVCQREINETQPRKVSRLEWRIPNVVKKYFEYRSTVRTVVEPMRDYLSSEITQFKPP